MNWLDAFERLLGRALEVVVTLAFACILCLTVTLVVLRYGFNSSIIWGSEAMNYLFIYSTALGAAAAVGKGSHIRISCIKDMTSGALRKAMDLAGCLLVGIVNGVMGWFSLPWLISAGSFESPVIRMPMWAVQISIPLGCGLASLFCLMHIIRILAGVDPEQGGASC